MPKIKLKQETGEYGWNKNQYSAGKIYNVTNQVAFYLVNNQKVANEVDINGNVIFLDLDDNVSKSIPMNPLNPPSPKTLKIAMIRLGGLGDTLILGVQARAVKRKYPDSYIVCFVRDKLSAEIILRFPEISHALSVGDKNWGSTLENIKGKDFDIVYDNKYITGVYYKDVNKFRKDKILTDNVFLEWIQYYINFPFNCNKLIKENPSISEYEVMYKTACLDGQENDLKYPLKLEDFNTSKLVENDKYVTIHNGADISRQTKCWSTEYWSKVVIYLKDKGYKVIQLGKRLEEVVEGAIDMTGKCPLNQSIGLLAKAQFHIDSEGGLVHLARMVGTRSIVLFGPTPINFFGYKENINVSSNIKCTGCYWKTDFWWRDCAEGYPLPPKCMEDLTPEKIYPHIDRIIKMDRIFDHDRVEDFYDKWAIEMPLDEGHYKAESWQWDRIYTMMDMVRGKDILEVGAGDGYCASVLKKRGYNVTVTEFSKIRIKRMKKNGINAVFADVNNLPFPDNSFDAVLAGEILEHIDSMGKGLQELERVCKPDGKIIISLPVSKLHWKFKGHLWGLEHHQILREGKLDMIVMGLERINRD